MVSFPCMAGLTKGLQIVNIQGIAIDTTLLIIGINGINWSDMIYIISGSNLTNLGAMFA